MTTPDLIGLLGALSDGQVEYIIVGGVAANLHGSLRTTLDLDVVYRRSSPNIERLVGCLSPLKPYLRGAPEGLPFTLDAAAMERGLNFTLTTTLGDLDLLGEIAGGGTFDQLVPHSQGIQIGTTTCLVVGLPDLIRLKRASGRAKDREALAELEALLEERDR